MSQTKQINYEKAAEKRYQERRLLSEGLETEITGIYVSNYEPLVELESNAGDNYVVRLNSIYEHHWVMTCYLNSSIFGMALTQNSVQFIS